MSKVIYKSEYGILHKVMVFFAQLFFTTKTRLSVFEKLASFMESGISIIDVLRILEKEYSATSDVTDIRPFAMREWVRKMDKEGATFSEVLDGWVPVSERILIQSGEESGDIEDAFKNCIETTSSTKEMIGTIVGKLTYPVILTSLLFGIIAFFSLEIVPILTTISPPSQWPSVSQDLYTISEFTTKNWYVVLLGLIAVIVLIKISLSHLTGPLRAVLDKIPPYTMYKTFQSSVLIISVSSMMRSGVPIQEALYKIAESSNKYLRIEINKVLQRLKAGMTEGDAFKTPFFDEETKVDIAVYSHTENIGEYMDAIGRSAIENGVSKISKIADIAKLLAFFFVAVFICWAYYSFFMVVQSVGRATGM